MIEPAGLMWSVVTESPSDARTRAPLIAPIGAGMAGVGAAGALHDLGYDVTVVEGRERLGGRTFTDDSLGAIADQAILRATGARGVRAIMEGVLLNTTYELPSRQDVTKCVIDEDVVRSKVNPTLVPVKETPKRQRQERTA